MKTTNVFYPNSLVFLYNNYQDFLEKWDDRPILSTVLIMLLLFSFPAIAILFSIWYIMDVFANVFDYLSIKLFVDLPLWGMRRQEEIERVKKISWRIKL